MANKNYRQYHNKEVTVETVDAVEIPEVKEEVVEEVPVPNPVVTGVVTDCAKLNVRKGPKKTAEVVGVILADTEVTIDTDKSTDGWYQVYTPEFKGFCMKDYIKVKS